MRKKEWGDRERKRERKKERMQIKQKEGCRKNRERERERDGERERGIERESGGWCRTPGHIACVSKYSPPFGSAGMTSFTYVSL